MLKNIIIIFVLFVSIGLIIWGITYLINRHKKYKMSLKSSKENFGISDGQCECLVTDSSGNLYAGGTFTTAGGIIVNSIAKWNASTSTWSALGAGLSGGSPTTSCSALVTDFSGNIYAGGSFTNAGGVPARFIAKWNTTTSTWSALGSGLNGVCNALAIDSSGTLYAGGYFFTIGNISVNSIAKWNGTTWSALGSGLNGQCNALAIDSSGNLYAGGIFTIAGNTPVSNIAKWNTTTSTWSALGGGLDGQCMALAIDLPGNLYAGGNFTTAGNTTANSIAKWNGSTWSNLGTGLGIGIRIGVCFALVADSYNNVYAGGSFKKAGGVSANYIAKWDGSTTWSALGSGLDSDCKTLIVDSYYTLYAGGSFANRISKWDGVWKPINEQLYYDVPPGNIFGITKSISDENIHQIINHFSPIYIFHKDERYYPSPRDTDLKRMNLFIMPKGIPDNIWLITDMKISDTAPTQSELGLQGTKYVILVLNRTPSDKTLKDTIEGNTQTISSRTMGDDKGNNIYITVTYTNSSNLVITDKILTDVGVNRDDKTERENITAEYELCKDSKMKYITSFTCGYNGGLISTPLKNLFTSEIPDSNNKIISLKGSVKSIYDIYISTAYFLHIKNSEIPDSMPDNINIWLITDMQILYTAPIQSQLGKQSQEEQYVILVQGGTPSDKTLKDTIVGNTPQTISPTVKDNIGRDVYITVTYIKNYYLAQSDNILTKVSVGEDYRITAGYKPLKDSELNYITSFTCEYNVGVYAKKNGVTQLKGLSELFTSEITGSNNKIIPLEGSDKITTSNGPIDSIYNIYIATASFTYIKNDSEMPDLNNVINYDLDTKKLLDYFSNTYTTLPTTMQPTTTRPTTTRPTTMQPTTRAPTTTRPTTMQPTTRAPTTTRPTTMQPTTTRPNINISNNRLNVKSNYDYYLWFVPQNRNPLEASSVEDNIYDIYSYLAGDLNNPFFETQNITSYHLGLPGCPGNWSDNSSFSCRNLSEQVLRKNSSIEWGFNPLICSITHKKIFQNGNKIHSQTKLGNIITITGNTTLLVIQMIEIFDQSNNRIIPDEITSNDNITFPPIQPDTYKNINIDIPLEIKTSQNLPTLTLKFNNTINISKIKIIMPAPLNSIINTTPIDNSRILTINVKTDSVINYTTTLTTPTTLPTGVYDLVWVSSVSDVWVTDIIYNSHFSFNGSVSILPGLQTHTGDVDVVSVRFLTQDLINYFGNNTTPTISNLSGPPIGYPMPIKIYLACHGGSEWYNPSDVMFRSLGQNCAYGRDTTWYTHPIIYMGRESHEQYISPNANTDRIYGFANEQIGGGVCWQPPVVFLDIPQDIETHNLRIYAMENSGGSYYDNFISRPLPPNADTDIGTFINSYVDKWNTFNTGPYTTIQPTTIQPTTIQPTTMQRTPKYVPMFNTYSPTGLTNFFGFGPPWIYYPGKRPNYIFENPKIRLIEGNCSGDPDDSTLTKCKFAAGEASAPAGTFVQRNSAKPINDNEKWNTDMKWYEPSPVICNRYPNPLCSTAEQVCCGKPGKDSNYQLLKRKYVFAITDIRIIDKNNYQKNYLNNPNRTNWSVVRKDRGIKPPQSGIDTPIIDNIADFQQGIGGSTIYLVVQYTRVDTSSDTLVLTELVTDDSKNIFLNNTNTVEGYESKLVGHGLPYLMYGRYYSRNCPKTIIGKTMTPINKTSNFITSLFVSVGDKAGPVLNRSVNYTDADGTQVTIKLDTNVSKKDMHGGCGDKTYFYLICGFSKTGYPPLNCPDLNVFMNKYDGNDQSYCATICASYCRDVAGSVQISDYCQNECTEILKGVHDVETFGKFNTYLIPYRNEPYRNMQIKESFSQIPFLWYPLNNVFTTLNDLVLNYGNGGYSLNGIQHNRYNNNKMIFNSLPMLKMDGSQTIIIPNITFSSNGISISYVYMFNRYPASQNSIPFICFKNSGGLFAMEINPNTSTRNQIILTLIKSNKQVGNVSINFTPTKLCHIVWTIDNSGTWRIYINGVIARTDINKGYPDNSYGNNYIGTTSNDMEAYIRDFRVYNTTLSNTDVAELYNSSISEYPSYWFKFNGNLDNSGISLLTNKPPGNYVYTVINNLNTIQINISLLFTNLFLTSNNTITFNFIMTSNTTNLMQRIITINDSKNVNILSLTLQKTILYINTVAMQNFNIELNTFYNIAVSQDNNRNTILYINGEQVWMSKLIASLTSANFLLGNSLNSSLFKGYISDLRFYDKVLDVNNISDIITPAIIAPSDSLYSPTPIPIIPTYSSFIFGVIGLMKSVDGEQTWNIISNNNPLRIIKNIIYNESYFLECGIGNNATVAKSKDGLNWNASNPFGSGGVVNSIKWNGTYWLAGGYNLNKNLCILNSLDGENWGQNNISIPKPIVTRIVTPQTLTTLIGLCNCLVTDSLGNLYAGGFFTTVVGINANNIAKWNASTSTWSALGSGLNGQCDALAIDSSGTLYAGGFFTTAGGVPANRIAKWNGKSWSALGSGLSGGCNALAIDSSGTLYAGGNFTTSGNIRVNHIAKWNGTTWSALGGGLSGACRALAIDSSGTLYAGGIFVQVGSILASRVAKWNMSTSTWSALGSGLNGQCNALAIDSLGNLYAGGIFTIAGNTPVSNIAKWNTMTSTWSSLGPYLGPNSNKICKALLTDLINNIYILEYDNIAFNVKTFNINSSTFTNFSLNLDVFTMSFTIDSKYNFYVGGRTITKLNFSTSISASTPILTPNLNTQPFDECEGFESCGYYWISFGKDTTGRYKTANSNDGINWTVYNKNFYSLINKIVWNGSYFLMIGRWVNPNNSSSTITFSNTNPVDPSTLTWNTILSDPFIGGQAKDVAWNGSYWVCVGNNLDGSVIAKSYNGFIWTISSNNQFNTGQINSISWNGLYWIATGNNRNSTVNIIKSLDGTTWTILPNPPGIGPGSLISGILTIGTYVQPTTTSSPKIPIIEPKITNSRERQNALDLYFGINKSQKFKSGSGIIQPIQVYKGDGTLVTPTVMPTVAPDVMGAGTGGVCGDMGGGVSIPTNPGYLCVNGKQTLNDGLKNKYVDFKNSEFGKKLLSDLNKNLPAKLKQLIPADYYYDPAVGGVSIRLDPLNTLFKFDSSGSVVHVYNKDNITIKIFNNENANNPYGISVTADSKCENTIHLIVNPAEIEIEVPLKMSLLKVTYWYRIKTKIKNINLDIKAQIKLPIADDSSSGYIPDVSVMLPQSYSSTFFDSSGNLAPDTVYTKYYADLINPDFSNCNNSRSIKSQLNQPFQTYNTENNLGYNALMNNLAFAAQPQSYITSSEILSKFSLTIISDIPKMVKDLVSNLKFSTELSDTFGNPSMYPTLLQLDALIIGLGGMTVTGLGFMEGSVAFAETISGLAGVILAEILTLGIIGEEISGGFLLGLTFKGAIDSKLKSIIQKVVDEKFKEKALKDIIDLLINPGYLINPPPIPM
jgi:hypothetical protein